MRALTPKKPTKNVDKLKISYFTNKVRHANPNTKDSKVIKNNQ
jgi:hypothetical protein